MEQLKLWTKKILGFLLGARFFTTIVLAFALYVSTFFIFNTNENIKDFVFDLKVHGIIFCGLMSILTGAMINQFYDQEKDRVVRPFRTKLQSFIQQKTYLISYLIGSILSLILAGIISLRVFIFYLIFQIFIWAYSHKLSRILILNNLLFVSLSLYPFFGMVIYFEAYNVVVFVMAAYLFLLLLLMDLMKDILSQRIDSVLGYQTLPNTIGISWTKRISIGVLLLLMIISVALYQLLKNHVFLPYYFLLGLLFFLGLMFLIVFKKDKGMPLIINNLLKIWIFIGIWAIALDGIFSY